MSSQQTSRIPSPIKGNLRQPSSIQSSAPSGIRTQRDPELAEKSRVVAPSTGDGRPGSIEPRLRPPQHTKISEPHRSVSAKQTASSKLAAPSSMRAPPLVPTSKPTAHSRSISHSAQSIGRRQDQTMGIDAQASALGRRPSKLQHSRNRSVTNTIASAQPRPQLETHRTLVGAKTRPEFSTYQQHFSPKKGPTPPAVVPAPAISHEHHLEIARLQDELLQLEILASCGRESIQKSRTRLADKTEEQRTLLERGHKDLEAEQLALASTLNSHGLAKWMESKPLGKGSPEEIIETLATLIKEITELTCDSGRAIRTLNEFEDWRQYCVDTGNTRMDGDTEDLPFAEPLGHDWYQNAALSIRSLSQCKRELELLGSADGSTGIGRVISAHQSYVSVILEELSLAEHLAKLAIDRERQYARTSVADVLKDEINRVRIPPQSNGAWEE